MKRGRKKGSMSIRGVILLLIMITTVVLTLLVGSLVFTGWFSSSRDMVSKIADDTNTGIYNRIRESVFVPVHIVEMNAKHLENGLLDLENEAEREQFFVSVLQAHSSELYSFSYATEEGEYYGARRNEQGAVEIMRNNAGTGGQSLYYSVNKNGTAAELTVNAGVFDPRTRAWYQAAIKAEGTAFSPVYKHFVMPDLTITVARPIHSKDGVVIGVLGAHTILSDFNGILKNVVVDRNGSALIVEKSTGDLIANSFDIQNFTTLSDGTLQRRNVAEIGSRSLYTAYDRYLRSDEESFDQAEGDDSLHIEIRELNENGLDWLILTAIPESLLMDDVFANMRMALLLILVTFAMTAAVYTLTAKRLIRPVDSLIEATEKFAAGDLRHRAVQVRDDEIGKIAASFNRMADTMESLIDNLEDMVQKRTAELEKANESLTENKDKLRLILDSTAEAIYGIDMDGNCTFCNTSGIELLGYQSEEQLLGQNMHQQIHHSYRDGHTMSAQECAVYRSLKLGKGAHVDNEVFWRADGTSFEVEYFSYPQYQDGKLVGAVVTFMDITKRKQDEEKIMYLSCHDSLTGLINRRCFEEELKKQDQPQNLPISIVFADINGLKLTNDIFGHASGDILIKKSADILKRSCREGDILARIGGDEFVMLLPRTKKADAEKIVRRVLSELDSEKVDAIRCSISLGADTKIRPQQKIERVMENAEDEMYKEKTLNRKRFGADMIQTIIRTLHERCPREKEHSENVSALCEKTGKALGLSETEIKRLKDAGYIHDIGKIVLDNDILCGDGGLTENDMKEMQQHPAVGYRILSLFDGTLDLAEGILGHHERWDGSGYPKGLKEEEIPLLSRIIALAESYDWKLADTRGKRQNSPEAAKEAIRRGAGKDYDPVLAEVFIKTLEQNNIF